VYNLGRLLSLWFMIRPMSWVGGEIIIEQFRATESVAHREGTIQSRLRFSDDLLQEPAEALAERGRDRGLPVQCGQGMEAR
jgi:hypothetical protein